MALASIYGLASTNAIPKKKEGRTVYYSKKHFDIANGVVNPENLLKLETFFTYNRNKDSIAVIRKRVETYERLVKEQAEKIERARLNAKEAEKLEREAETL